MLKLNSIARYFTLSGVILFAMIMLSASTGSASDLTAPSLTDDGAPYTEGGCHSNHTKVYKSPWMIYGNDPTRMHILFETEQHVKNDSHHIKIDFDQSGISCSRDYTKMVIDNGADRRLWTFSCTGFEPEKRYSFTISYRKYYYKYYNWCWYHDGGWFTTPPPNDDTVQELKFYGYGDTRAYDDKSNTSAVAKRIYEHHNSHGKEGVFIIHTGDIVPEGGNVATQSFVDRWGKSFWDIGNVTDMLAQLPIFTTIGNHDFACDVCKSWDNPLGCNDCVDDFISYKNTLYETEYQPHYYYRYFKYPMYHNRPSGGDLGNFYYSFHWGPAEFYSLTTYPMVHYCTYSPSLTTHSDQYKWLEKSLKDFDLKGKPWKIVFMHAPPYDAAGGSGCSQQQIRDNYIPLFEKYGVDLVLNGHEHYYGRKTLPTPPDPKTLIKEGITYMVLGGGGATLANKKNFCCPEDMDVADNTKYHFAYFEIEGDKMTVNVIDKDGNTFDTFSIDKRPKADFKVDGATTGPAPLEVQFENLSTGHISSYEWDFGDGITSTTELSPTHVYNNWGYYTVTLSVDSGLTYNTMTKQDLVRVGYDAGFSAYPSRGVRPLTVEFEPWKPDAEYGYWDFGDGTTLEATGVISHTYTGEHYGNITVKHTVGDDHGNRITLTKSDLIKVEPYADFTFEVRNASDPYNFHFYDLSQGGGGVFSYGWSFGDQTGSGEQNPVHEYDEWWAGSLEVTLSVVFNDDSGGVLRDEITKTVIVPAPDEYDADFSGKPTVGALPLTVKFTPSTDYPYRLWDFGDGTYSDDPGTVLHTYTSLGTFTPKHTAGYNGFELNTTWIKPYYIVVHPYNVVHSYKYFLPLIINIE